MIKLLFGFLLIISTVIFMEVFSWAIHKYIFHGILWNIHKTHHKPRTGWFELNDIFSFSFAVIAIVLLVIGIKEISPSFWIGLGITLYGIIYFIFHDVFIHNRLKAFKSSNPYLLRIRRAHKIHHKSQDKNPSESFGLLYVGKKYSITYKK